MRTALVLATLLTGCSAEQGFGESKPTTVEAGGEGRAAIFPTDGVNLGPFDIGHTEQGGFRIDSTGEFPLQVLSMSLIDAGENAGIAVFADLRPHVSTNIVPFEIAPGEGSEFLVTASMSEAGTATGEIEIYTNDSTVNDGGPGYVRVPLSAIARDPGGDEEDTGSETPEDTGSEAPEDTGSSSSEEDGDESSDEDGAGEGEAGDAK